MMTWVHQLLTNFAPPAFADHLDKVGCCDSLHCPQANRLPTSAPVYALDQFLRVRFATGISGPFAVFQPLGEDRFVPVEGQDCEALPVFRRKVLAAVKAHAGVGRPLAESGHLAWGFAALIDIRNGLAVHAAGCKMVRPFRGFADARDITPKAGFLPALTIIQEGPDPEFNVRTFSSPMTAMCKHVTADNCALMGIQAGPKAVSFAMMAGLSEDWRGSMQAVDPDEAGPILCVDPLAAKSPA